MVQLKMVGCSQFGMVSPLDVCMSTQQILSLCSLPNLLSLSLALSLSRSVFLYLRLFLPLSYCLTQPLDPSGAIKRERWHEGRDRQQGRLPTFPNPVHCNASLGVYDATPNLLAPHLNFASAMPNPFRHTKKSKNRQISIIRITEKALEHTVSDF